MEQWKTFRDYPDYQVSNLGRVRRTSDKFIRKWTDTSGCLTMSFKGGRNGNTNRTQTYVMRTHWKYEFIKDLYDDEECKDALVILNISSPTMAGCSHSRHTLGWTITSGQRSEVITTETITQKCHSPKMAKGHLLVFQD